MKIDSSISENFQANLLVYNTFSNSKQEWFHHKNKQNKDSPSRRGDHLFLYYNILSSSTSPSHSLSTEMYSKNKLPFVVSISTVFGGIIPGHCGCLVRVIEHLGCQIVTKLFFFLSCITNAPNTHEMQVF